ncbi:MAG: hypothetical protein AB7F31_05320 [Parachlamydiales bacterium]
MDTSGINPNIPVNPPSGPSGPPNQQDTEAMLIAALLSIMGVNQLWLEKYMGNVQDAEKWIQWALGLKGIVNAKNAGEITNEQYNAFANGYQALEKRLKALEEQLEKEGKKIPQDLPPEMKTLYSVLNTLAPIYKDLVNLNKLEQQVPIDIQAVAAAKKKVTDDVTTLIFPTTPDGQNTLNILKNNLNQFTQAISTPALVLAKQAMQLINQINSLAQFTSSMMKKVQEASEMIWQLTLK